MQQIGQHAGYAYAQNNQGSVVSNQGTTGFKQIVQNPTSSNQSSHQQLPQTLSSSQTNKWHQMQQLQNRVQQIHQQQQSGNFRPVVSSLTSTPGLINGNNNTLTNQRISPRPHQTYTALPKQHQGIPLSRSMSANQSVSALNVTNSGQIQSTGLPARASMQQRLSPHIQTVNKNMTAHAFGSSRSNSTGDINSLQASSPLLNGGNVTHKLANVTQSSYNQLPHQNTVAQNQVPVLLNTLHCTIIYISYMNG